MSDNISPAAKVTSKSREFRIIFTNHIGIRITPNDVAVTFGIDHPGANRDNEIVEEAVVMMTPVTVKIVAQGLLAAMEKFEKTNGPIPVPQSKMDEINRAIEAGTKRVSQSDKS